MEQIRELRPSLYKKIRQLSKQGSIEWFGAGYYEPILSVIPSKDRVSQIDMLSRSIEKMFQQTPKGLWLTERVWESALIPDLERAGIRYTVMDDYHFLCTGFQKEKLDGYYITEEGGVPMGLFPISQKLRYAVPFMSVEGAIEAIRSFGRTRGSAAILFDDAEKFGMWPGTFEWVYEKGWLEKFVQAVLEDESIETLTYGEYFDRSRPRGIAYLPNVSYFEMGEWSLNADDAVALEDYKRAMGLEKFESEGIKFLKGGIWKNFFVKYPESNRIHKRMLELSTAPERKGKAYEDALFRLQTNDALWHGVFGGLYLPNLRDTAYRYMIDCENIRYKNTTGIFEENSFFEGCGGYKIVSDEVIWRFEAEHGAQLCEFDLRDSRFNYQNTLTRRKEAYHEHLFDVPEELPAQSDGIDTIHVHRQADESLREKLNYDWYLKHSFIDHISDEGFDAGSFYRCSFREYGDFANQPFEKITDSRGIVFVRQGGLYFPEKASSHLEKKFVPNGSALDFTITFNTSAEGHFRYVCEFNFHFAEYDTLLFNSHSLGEGTLTLEGHSLVIVDPTFDKKLVLSFERDCRFDLYRLETLSQSEEGFDVTVQGISIAASFGFEKGFALNGSMGVVNV